MNIYRKFIIQFALTLFVAFSVIVFNYEDVVCSSLNSNNHIDAILVFDTSNSMNNNDPLQIAVEGVKYFIDMLEYKGSRVGVIGFNGRIMFQIPLTDISSFDDKREILNRISDISYSGYTDIGMALKKAEELLYGKADKGNKKMIVMFTDGYVEVDKNTGRTEQDSHNEINQVLLGARDNYPIYTVGLNANDRVDKELLERIAGETSAENYMTRNAEDLPQIFHDIFAAQIRSNVIEIGTVTGDGRGYSEVKIDIPNNSVAEANISMLSGDTILDVLLVDPLGNVHSVNSRNIYFSTSKLYSLIKIVEPASGEWTLRVKGVDGDSIKVNLIYNYNISLEASIKQGQTAAKGNSVTIEARLKNENSYITDAELIDSLNAELYISDTNGNVIDRISMQILGDYYLASYTLPHDELTLEMVVKLAGSGFYRDSNILYIELVNMPPEIIDEIPNMTFFHFPRFSDSKEIDVSQYFEDIDDIPQELEYSAKVLDGTIDISTNDSVITISPLMFYSFGEAEIEIICADPSGKSALLSFKVTLIPILPIVVAVVLLIFFIILIPLLIKLLKGKPILLGYGKCVSKINGIHSMPERKELVLLGKKGTLSQCVSNSEILSALPELSKITFEMAEGRYVLNFNNKSSYDIHAGPLPMDKKFSIEPGRYFTVSNSSNGAELIFTYED